MVVFLFLEYIPSEEARSLLILRDELLDFDRELLLEGEDEEESFDRDEETLLLDCLSASETDFSRYFDFLCPSVSRLESRVFF